MKTVIYLDELLLTNFLAAAALLLGAGLLCARQCSGLRLMAGSAAAAAASLGILLPELPGPAAFLYKVFTCCAAVAAAYGVPGLRNFVQLCVWYLLLNLLLCGAVLLPGVQSANLCVYLPLSPGRLLLCCGAVLAVLRGVLFCFGRAGTRCFAAVLELEGAVLSVQAFCDTGFSVQNMKHEYPSCTSIDIDRIKRFSADAQLYGQFAAQQSCPWLLCFRAAECGQNARCTAFAGAQGLGRNGRQHAVPGNGGAGHQPHPQLRRRCRAAGKITVQKCAQLLRQGAAHGRIIDQNHCLPGQRVLH